MKIIFQVIKNYGCQEVAAVVLTTANKKYYFNMPETFQRFMKNNHVKLNPSNAIFLTRLATPNICGLFGQMLTMFESKAAFDTIIFGPSGTAKFFDKIRFKMGYKILPFSFLDIHNPSDFLYGFQKMETIMQVTEHPKYSSFFYEMNKFISENYSGKQFKEEINDPTSYFTKENNFFKDEICEIHPIKQSGNSLSYVVVPEKIQGKVLKDKLKEYGIKGKAITELIKNGSMTLQDGKVVLASDIQEESQPSTIVIIVDIENEIDLIEFQSHPLIKSLLKSSIDSSQLIVSSIIHLANNINVVKQDKYQEFFKLFGDDCQHIFSCQELNDLSSLKEKDRQLVSTNFSHFSFIQTIHSALPHHFPNLSALEDITKEGLIDAKTVFPILSKVTVAQRYFDYVLQPLKSQGYFGYFGTQTKEFIADEEVKAKLGGYSVEHKLQEGVDFSEYDPEIVFLGTGSMKPAAYRNVSSIFVRNEKNNHGILFDCGEGTFYQLLNQYGEAKLKTEILPNLKIIFISHIHSDHHLGMLNIIRQRSLAISSSSSLESNELFVVIPFNMVPWIETYSEMIEKLNCRIIFNQELTSEGYTFSDKICESLFGSMSKESLEYYEHPLQDEFVSKLRKRRNTDLKLFNSYLAEQNIIQFLTIPVDHCPQSYALVIKHHSQFKIVYSGDLRPSEELCTQGKNATIFIHEATFNDDLAENAKKNMHCTVKEAALSAIKANAWRLVLTHFSQRYQKVVLPEMDEAFKASMSLEDQEYYKYLETNSVLAFDHLSATSSQFASLPYKTRVAQELFPSE